MINLPVKNLTIINARVQISDLGFNVEYDSALALARLSTLKLEISSITRVYFELNLLSDLDRFCLQRHSFDRCLQKTLRMRSRQSTSPGPGNE